MMYVWLLMAVMPFLALVTIGDAYVLTSMSLANRLGLRRCPELPLLIVLVALLFLIFWLMDVVESQPGTVLAEDPPNFSQIVNGEPVLPSGPELAAFLDEFDRQHGKPATRWVLILEVLSMAISLPVVTVLAIRQRRPLLIWLPVALLGNIGAIVWLKKN